MLSNLGIVHGPRLAEEAAACSEQARTLCRRAGGPRGETAPRTTDCEAVIDVVMDITGGHLQLAHASRITGVIVGATWRPASVTHRSGDTFRAVVPGRPRRVCNLRVHATDATAGSITETITRGYQIAA